jgi:hypothetical protein
MPHPKALLLPTFTFGGKVTAIQYIQINVRKNNIQINKKYTRAVP